MTTLTSTAPQYLTAAEFRKEWITEFISFIDRTPRTAHAYITNLRAFFAYMNYSQITNPQRADIINYRDYLLSEHRPIRYEPTAPQGWIYTAVNTVTLKAATVKAYLQAVCAFFRWTAAERLYPNIADNIHAPKVDTSHKKNALTIEQSAKVERCITENAANQSKEQLTRTRAIFLLAVTAGLRTVEISRLKIKDIEAIDNRYYIYIWGKGHAEADTRKAIAAEVYEAIQEYISSRTDHTTADSFLFVGSGNRSHGQPIRPDTISKMLKQALKAAGYNSDRLTAHSLRHTAGTAIYNLTSDIYTTQQYMRHANPATTEIYIHAEANEKESDLAELLYNKIKAAATA